MKCHISEENRSDRLPNAGSVPVATIGIEWTSQRRRTRNVFFPRPLLPLPHHHFTETARTAVPRMRSDSATRTAGSGGLGVVMAAVHGERA